MIGTQPGILATALARAAEVIGQGGIVAFPTETFYGLAVDPFNETAVRRLFALKGRAPTKPILVLIDGLERLGSLAREVPILYPKLMNSLWPGPLTLIFPGREQLPPLLTDALGTIGIRWSSHPVASRLARACGGVITGTSANPSGWPPAVTSADLRKIFRVGLDYIVEGGTTPGGLGSTIVGMGQEQLQLIRPGAISFAEIKAIAGLARKPSTALNDQS
jgi:L-threonylcarbamoyladenylate synthase